MKNIEVLLIDDDEKLADLLGDYLNQYSIKLAWAADPHMGKIKLQTSDPNLIILDVMMPRQDGFSFVKELRASGNQIPVIMLTARGESTDRVLGLELGADDYLPKPFQARELVARINSVLRRIKPRQNIKNQIFGHLEIRTQDRNAFLEGKDLDLTTAEFEILNLLASKPGKKFSRDEIMNHLNGVDSDVYSRSIDNLVSRIRIKLNDQEKPSQYIKTVWGTGYVFIKKPGDQAFNEESLK